MKKVRPLSDAVLKELDKATPPPKFPRGYFDPLVMPTRKLLDKGLKIHQAADWLIKRGALKSRERLCFMDAMHGRISRLARKKVASGNPFAWMGSLFYESTHLVQDAEKKAICGASASVWDIERSDTNRCARCIGLARKNGIVRI